MSIFHLALPSHDLAASKEFYTQSFGAVIGREYSGYVIFNFFGHQVVLHLDSDAAPTTVEMYPRHCGLIFENRADFDRLYDLCKSSGAPFFEDLFERFKDKAGWHFSFFVSDPSNNLIEFKYYVNQQDIFN